MSPATLSRPAVLAPHLVGAVKPISPAHGLVDAASFISDILLVHEFIGRKVGASLAAKVVWVLITGDQKLRRDVDICVRRARAARVGTLNRKSQQPKHKSQYTIYKLSICHTYATHML